MAGSFFDRIKQGLGLGGSGDDGGRLPQSKLTAHFAGLAKADRALPAAVVRYIADGCNSSVLSSLQGNGARTAWSGRAQIWPRRDEEALFADLGKWTADQMRRFGEALEALDPLTYSWGVFGTKASPVWLRHVVTIWLTGDRIGQPVDVLVALAAETGDPTGPVLDIVFSPDGARYGSDSSLPRFSGVPGWLAQEQETIAAAVRGLGADVRAMLAGAIGRFGLADAYVETLLDLATGSSKKARAAAQQALTACGGEVLEAALEARFAKAAPGQRAELVGVVGASMAERGAALLVHWRQNETAPKVLAALDQMGSALATVEGGAGASAGRERSDGPDGYWAVDGAWVDAGPDLPIAALGPVPRDLLATLEPAMDEFNRMLRIGKAEASADKKQWHWSKPFSLKDARDLRKLAELAEGTKPLTDALHHEVVHWLRFEKFRHPAVEAFLRDPRLSDHHFARLAVEMCRRNIYWMFGEWSGPVGAAMQHRLAQGMSLRHFVKLWNASGGQDFVADYLKQRWNPGLPEFDAPLWPVLCSHLDEIDQALGLVVQGEDKAHRTSAGLNLLAHFPKLPERYQGRLMLLASDSSSHIREKARALLQQVPGLESAIVVQLQDGKQDVRAQAANWLAARQAKGEVPHLHKALVREKSDVARAAMISAVERLGGDVSAYFDQALLVKEAKAGLAKPKPKGIDWFRFDTLPALQWADGSAVDPLLPQWWVTLAAKLKQPGGNALVNLWLDRLAPGHAHKLGWLVLTSWIDEDIRRPTDEEANAHAAQHVDATVQQNLVYVKRWPESADYFPTDRGVVFARLKQAKAGEYLGSAVDSKGLLALAARVNGADAVQRIRPFLKDHGARVSQAKALLEVLAAIGSSTALQLLLSAANRSKQRSVQAHAAALVEEIAERNGWSAAQMADRTVPTGGFDIDGTQDLDLGEGRTYRLQLDATDAVIVVNPDGREVKALPSARVDEEKPAVDAAKKQLSTARKEVKQVFTSQTERLQEAMFLQRGWVRAEWESFVAGHPLVGRLAARLIWLGEHESGNALGTFRPLGDGSHTDSEDGDVALDAFATIRLAHSTMLSADEIAAWRRHLADYAVAPPFDQLGRDLPVLDEAQKGSRAITDREGWMIETFKLRGTATKLGYQRGPAQDGGWFLTYEKTYREAGLMAEIGFSGSPLPEENRPAALEGLTFRKLRGATAAGQVALGEVPPVLLAETWRDLHDIADKGTGFDPEWNKKVY